MEGIDEILFMDSVASLYGRNHLSEIIKEASSEIFVPFTVGGGVRSIMDVEDILRSGADKVAINTAILQNPKLISEVANQYGSQCMVASIEAKSRNNQSWEAFSESGREPSGKNVIEWAKTCEKLGAGEILITSIDREGTRKGFDVNLIKAVTSSVNVPVIASGGMGRMEDFEDVVANAEASAVAIADFLHYERGSIESIRDFATQCGLKVRRFEKN